MTWILNRLQALYSPKIFFFLEPDLFPERLTSRHALPKLEKYETVTTILFILHFSIYFSLCCSQLQHFHAAEATGDWQKLWGVGSGARSWGFHSGAIAAGGVCAVTVQKFAEAYVSSSFQEGTHTKSTGRNQYCVITSRLPAPFGEPVGVKLVKYARVTGAVDRESWIAKGCYF